MSAVMPRARPAAVPGVCGVAAVPVTGGALLLGSVALPFAKTTTATVTGSPSVASPSARPDESEFGSHLTAPKPLSSPGTSRGAVPEARR